MALKGSYTSEGVWGGGGGTYILTQFHTGGALTRGPTPYLFTGVYTIFGIKDAPFVFLLLKNGTPVTYYFGRVFWSWLVCPSC